MKRPIENNSAPGDAVYDPFCGSGTTLIAAERACR
jgi:DNA modification methylase